MQDFFISESTCEVKMKLQKRDLERENVQSQRTWKWRNAVNITRKARKTTEHLQNVVDYDCRRLILEVVYFMSLGYLLFIEIFMVLAE